MSGADSAFAVAPVVLAGKRVRLEPLAAHHLPGLGEAIRDGALWTLPVTIIPHPDDLPGFLRDAETALVQGRELAFATIDIGSGAVVGSTRFRNIERAHRRVEIGFTFIAASRQRSPINTEAKYLMLEHAFDTWHCHRVELLTDVLNTRSRTAIARIGAREEGILRSHMVMRDGRIRDSVIFSITRGEWRTVERALAEKIALG